MDSTFCALDFLLHNINVISDYKLNSRTGSCYNFHRLATSWKRAQAKCLAEGGYLAIINDDTEAAVLGEIYGENPVIINNSEYTPNIHLGYLDWGLRGLWFTVHGKFSSSCDELRFKLQVIFRAYP